MPQLPDPFVQKMQRLLVEQFDDFILSYEHERKFGLRVNPLKIDALLFAQLQAAFAPLSPVLWAEGAYYYDEQQRPGKHPFYHAGLYYIQEPSAMVPVELLDVQPGHKVLDLCAAPGGKSTQIAGKLQQQGVLVTNDNATERAKVLAKNVELAGIRNAVVLNEQPAKISNVFPQWFDRILVDAPCSGEGMFRKDESMIQEWEKHSVERCARMQEEILHDAATMLAPGGMLVYSTCTFSPEENELQIAKLLAARPDFEVVPMALRFGWQHGRPDWIVEAQQQLELSDERLASISGTVRLWPHLTEGEGHFVAVLRRQCDERTAPAQQQQPTSNVRVKRPDKRLPRHAATTPVDAHASWQQFATTHLTDRHRFAGKVVTFGSRVYVQPEQVPSLDGLKVVRPGWFVGEAGTYRFAPSQSLAMGLSVEDATFPLQLDVMDDQVKRFLRGETVEVSAEQAGDLRKGYTLICCQGLPLGWGKFDGHAIIKNELPAGWRMI